MTLEGNYLERVYSGILGKLIGVYLGRPFENWTYERILSELGQINYYVHERLEVPLVVTDDDVAGTFTFIRALEDYELSKNEYSKLLKSTYHIFVCTTIDITVSDWYKLVHKNLIWT